MQAKFSAPYRCERGTSQARRSVEVKAVDGVHDSGGGGDRGDGSMVPMRRLWPLLRPRCVDIRPNHGVVNIQREGEADVILRYLKLSRRHPEGRC